MEIEPSQKERRAQALHRYKQKRKVVVLPTHSSACAIALMN